MENDRPIVRIENWELLYFDEFTTKLRGVTSDIVDQSARGLGLGFGLCVSEWDVTTGKIVHLDLVNKRAETKDARYILGTSLKENMENAEKESSQKERTENGLKRGVEGHNKI